MALKWLSHGSQRGKWLDPAFLWYTWAFPRGMCYHLALPLRKVYVYSWDLAITNFFL